MHVTFNRAGGLECQRASPLVGAVRSRSVLLCRMEVLSARAPDHLAKDRPPQQRPHPLGNYQHFRGAHLVGSLRIPASSPVTQAHPHVISPAIQAKCVFNAVAPGLTGNEKPPT